MDLKEAHLTDDDANSHWYYRSKSEMMLARVARLGVDRVLDIGSGSAFFARQIMNRTQATEIVCLDSGYEAESSEQHSGKTISFVPEIRHSDAELMVLMDVLEHIEDDRAFLEHFVTMARPGTYFFITVPAFQFLWSGHDVYLEHFRRYRLSQIRAVATDVGLDIHQSHYFFGTLFPVAAALRLAERFLGSSPPSSDMRKFGDMTNALAYRICKAEIPISRLNMIAGLSAVILARKPPA